jgi:hypothetical protein
MRFLLLFALILACPAYAKSGGKSSASCASTHAFRGGGHGRVEPRAAPPLASDRKVQEQDCTKPIDWSAGNVKCK